MLGLGFDKAKLLASAEKNVKQGKLQNAIADYERVAKEDPRDLNVLNTIGDLYARVGNVDQATAYFKRAGEAYASEGFTVKAIAVYKKLTKQNPNAFDSLLKLAELYAQQGLNTDARVQYTVVAEQYLRTGNTGGAVNIFQKLLELDPENAQMQTKLADLYVRLGKKQDARDIYFRSAQALRSRGMLDACDDALREVLKLDPTFSQALLMSGEVCLERGDAARAVKSLESLPDIDSRAEGLRLLLGAQLKLHHIAEAEPLARKLLAVFNDVSAVALYAEALITAGDFQRALNFYGEHAAKLLAADSAAVVQALHKLIGPLKNNARALEMLRELLQKAGNTPDLTDVTELLAHAYVQEGSLTQARDLYKNLSELEPENPLHAQNYNQIMARLGQDSTTRELTPEEGVQPVMAEELELTPAPIEQQYAPDVTAALSDALTDSELFASYNLPARAIPPLEAILPRVPRDVQVNQRLASLYARMGRFAEAAQRCEVLKAVYAETNLPDEAQQYAQLAQKYSERTGRPAEPAKSSTPPPAPEAKGLRAEPAPAVEKSASKPGSAATPAAGVSAASPGLASAAPVEGRQAPARDAVAHEIDLSEEWERVISDHSKAAPEPTSSVVAWEAPSKTPAGGIDAALGDIIEETRFYLAQGMMDEARGALARAEAMSPNAPAVVELQAQLASTPRTPALKPENAASPAPPPFAVVQPDVRGKANEPALTVSDLGAPLAAVAPIPPANFQTTSNAPPQPTPDPISDLLPDLAKTPSVTAHQPATENVFAPRTAAVSTPRVRAGIPPPDLLDDLVLDLEKSLGPDFVLAATQGRSSPPAPATVPPPPRDEPKRKVSNTTTQPRIEPVPPPSNPASSAYTLAEETAGLAGLFEEFKHDLESSTAENDDPETHYSLGVAFKEMGLYDEAIGELQKVCQAFERGHTFSQPIAAYTWLADCFVQKGVPEAGVHWYEKALQVPGVGDERAVAIHYEMACACEAAGDTAAARRHFMHVLSANIDYRDVAERIKALKS